MDDTTGSQNYISLAEAAEQSPYTQEYLSLRARQGKLQAVKQGRNWVTTQAWLADYINQVDESKHELAEVMVEKPTVSLSQPVEVSHQNSADTEPVHQLTDQYAHYRPYNELPKTAAAPVASIKAEFEGVEHHPVAVSRPTLPKHDISSKLSIDSPAPTGKHFSWDDESFLPHKHISPYEAPEAEEAVEPVSDESLYHPISVAYVSDQPHADTDSEPVGSYEAPPTQSYPSFDDHAQYETSEQTVSAAALDDSGVQPTWDDYSFELSEEEEDASEKVGKTVLNSLVITACALFFFMAATIFNEPLQLTKNINAGVADINNNVHSGLIAVGAVEDSTDTQYANVPTYTYDQSGTGTVAGASDEKPTIAQNLAAGVVTLVTGPSQGHYTGNQFADWLIDIYDLP